MGKAPRQAGVWGSSSLCFHSQKAESWMLASCSFSPFYPIRDSRWGRWCHPHSRWSPPFQLNHPGNTLMIHPEESFHGDCKGSQVVMKMNHHSAHFRCAILFLNCSDFLGGGCRVLVFVGRAQIRDKYRCHTAQVLNQTHLSTISFAIFVPMHSSAHFLSKAELRMPQVREVNWFIGLAFCSVSVPPG